MSWLRRTALNLLPTLAITLVLLAAVDFFFGQRLLAELQHRDTAIERQYRIRDDFYHHGLKPSYNGLGVWGGKTYPLCTNAAGFKDACSRAGDTRKDFDIAFIGDSFTEGVGLPYEQSFVGRVAASLPQLHIANLGVGGYSPSIYLAKIRKLLEDGYHFGRVFVYIDISDIQDAATLYEHADGVVTPMRERTAYTRFRSRMAESFPIIFQGVLALRARWWGGAGNEPFEWSTYYLSEDYQKGAWTYDDKAKGYGVMGVEGAVDKSLKLMAELHALLSARGIPMSIGVYPWPGQLLHDVEESRQVTLWRTFCATRCEFFVNSFPTFFAEARASSPHQVIETFFIPGDVHHSAEGARLMADDFLRAFRRE